MRQCRVLRIPPTIVIVYLYWFLKTEKLLSVWSFHTFFGTSNSAAAFLSISTFSWILNGQGCSSSVEYYGWRIHDLAYINCFRSTFQQLSPPRFTQTTWPNPCHEIVLEVSQCTGVWQSILETYFVTATCDYLPNHLCTPGRLKDNMWTKLGQKIATFCGDAGGNGIKSLSLVRN